jgi:hypothetical protein
MLSILTQSYIHHPHARNIPKIHNAGASPGMGFDWPVCPAVPVSGFLYVILQSSGSQA